MDCNKFKDQMTRVIPSFAGFTEWTPTIPKMYWDVKSQEQRIKGICEMLAKVICYADMLGEETDEIAKTLQDILDGKLDTMIQDAIVAWFDENQPDIMDDIDELQRTVQSLNFTLTQLQYDVARDETDIRNLKTKAETLESKFTGKYIGVLSTFRFGFRPPADFDVDTMLLVAQHDYDIFYTYGWTYMPQSDDMRQEIPLYTESPYNPGWQGEHVTCGGLVQDVLYRCGYTDIADPDSPTHAMRTGRAVPEYLEAHGWIREDDFNNLVNYPGSIIFQGARSEYELDGEGNRVLVNNPSHVFIMKNYSYTDPITIQGETIANPYGMGECFDAGNDKYIVHHTPVIFNINSYQGRGYDILTQLQWRATETGLYTFYAPWPYNNQYKYTYDPWENDEIKPDLYEYQGYTIQDENGNVFQHFECPEGIVSQWFTIYDVLHATFRLRALGQAIAAEYFNTRDMTDPDNPIDPPTVTIDTTNVDRESGVFLTWNFGRAAGAGDTNDCVLRADGYSIEPQYRGLWLINGRFNFASSSSNTGIITVSVWEGNYNPDGATEAERWADCTLIGYTHCPATDASPTAEVTILETIAPNDHPVFAVVWGGGLTNPVTVRNFRYNTTMRLTRFR